MNISKRYANENHIGIEERRAILYTSLLRVAPEATYFRERALDQVVLGGLLGSSETDPMKASVVERNLYKDSKPFTLRVETVKKSLDRLVEKGLASTHKERQKSVYFLTEKGEKTLEKALSEGEDYFSPVIKRLLQDMDVTVTFDIGTEIVHHFILRCFGQFGRQIANSVLGLTDRERLANYDEVEYAFQDAIAKHDLDSNIIESLRYRCVSFLKSKHPHDEKLKFHLTQSYYLLEILGANGSSFDPLAEQTFNGSIFYLDTNVIITGLLSFHNGASPFQEMIALAKRLGIQLKVTGTTIKEISVVINRRISEIGDFFKKVPEKIKDLVHDDFLESYFAACERNPTLTLEAFFEPFVSPTQHLTDWGIIVDEEIPEELIRNPHIEHIGTIIQEEAFNTRGREKTPNILRHDLSHFALVMHERKHNPRVWFLTNDRSLENAANRISEDSSNHEKPICFVTIGFLQSISPFICSETEERSLTDVFSALVSAQMMPPQGLFEINELLLISELHEDVMATPKDDLVPALDYMKKKILEGRPYRVEEMPRITAELKRFLSKSKDERQSALEEENNRLTGEVKKTTAARAKLEKQYKEEQEERTRLQRKVKNLTIEGTRRDEEIDALTVQMKHIEENAERRLESLDRELKQESARRWRDRAFISVVLAVVLWLLSEYLGSLILMNLQISINLPIIVKLVNGIGLFVFVIPSLMWLHKELWTREKKTLIYVVILTLAFFTSRLLSSDVWGLIASIIEVAVLFSSAVFLFLSSD